MVKKPDNGKIQEDSEGRKIREWSEADSGASNLISNNLFDCTIKSHKETSEGYVYEILWDSGKSTTVVQGVPHKAIVLLDQPEVGDQHIWNSFRHHISMGDIFPDSWKDLLGGGQTDDQADIEEEQPLHDGGEL